MADIHTPLLLKVPLRSYVRHTLKRVLLGSNTALQSIYDYAAENIKGESPVLRIMSSASDRPPLTFKGSRTIFGILLQTLILFQDTENDWTPANAEDTLDLVEAQLAAVLYNNNTWTGSQIISVKPDVPTAVRRDVVQGETYLQELIPILVEVKNDGKQ